VSALDAEDAKLVTLARAAQARVAATSGAAVRDTDGRTYAATPVALPSLTLSALQAAVVMAVSAGAAGLEAAAVVAGAPGAAAAAAAGAVAGADEAGVAAVRDLGGSGVPVLLVAPDGSLLGRARS
jgi:hypothetical protein